MLGTFAVGVEPYGVVFDGVSIWVTNETDNTVTKLRASDGALEATLPTGPGPYGIAFDGANVWVTNSDAGTVSKL
jgi:DNA-binding beta-propeller fold protein YncE